MSKPMTRIAFTALIVLALVVGIYVSVQAAASRVSLSGERVITTAGLMPDTSHIRSAGQNLSSYYYEEGAHQNKGEGQGGCERDRFDD